MKYKPIELPDEILELFPPDERGLLDWFRARISKEELIHISECDSWYHEEDLGALLEIWRTGDVVSSIDCDAHEVMQLSTHVGIADDEYSGVIAGFCCATLLRQEDRDGMPDYLLGRLMEALYGMDEEVYLLAAKFSAFVLGREEEIWEMKPFWTCAFLFFASHCRVAIDWMNGIEAWEREEYQEEWGRSIRTFLEFQEYLRIEPWHRAVVEMENRFALSKEWQLKHD